MAVRADERLAGRREPLAVDIVANAVAGPGEPRAVFRGDGLQKPVIIGVLEVDLKNVVVDVDDRCLDLDAVDFEELELHHGHRPGGVLGQRLIDAEGDLGTGYEVAADEVIFEDRAGKRGHLASV